MLRANKSKASAVKASKPQQQKIQKRKITTKKTITKKRTPTSALNITTRRQFSTDADAKEEAEKPATFSFAKTEEVDLLAEAPVLLTHVDLTKSAHLGDVLKIKECLAQVEPKLDVNCYDQFGQTPLIHAIKARNLKSMQLLIQAGADVNLVDKQKFWPPVCYAIRKNSVSVFRTLMLSKPKVFLTVPGNRTPLSIAAESGTQITILNDLLEFGFNIDHRDDQGKTALMYAAKSCAPRELEWFLNLGANPSLKDKSGKDALAYAKPLLFKNNYRLIKSRLNEYRRYANLDSAEEDQAVKQALQQIKNDINEKNKIKKGKEVKTAEAVKA